METMLASSSVGAGEVLAVLLLIAAVLGLLALIAHRAGRR
jgi:hypothetical protein